MPPKIDDSVSVLTGASSGIGRPAGAGAAASAAALLLWAWRRGSAEQRPEAPRAPVSES